MRKARRGRGRSEFSLVLWLLVAACSDGGTGPAAFNGGATFDAFWSTFDESYSYFEYKRIDWNALGASYRPRAARTASSDELVAVLREMAAPLRDVHVTFTSPSGEQLPTWVPAHGSNWNQGAWARHVSAHGWQQRANWGFARFGDIGYMAIGGWTQGVDIAVIDSVLEQFRALPALIIDVRPNGGGNDELALRVAARFATTRTHFGSVRFRNGPHHSDFGPVIDRFVEPRGPWQYQHPVAVLAGRAVFSSNETFIAAMRELPHVTVIGDTTGGSSGNPGSHDLGDGWTYRVPRWIASLVDGTVIEWNGIPPDIALTTSTLDFDGETDPVIDFAEQWLANVVLPQPEAWSTDPRDGARR